MNAEFRLNGKTIETKRLILRPFVRTDLPFERRRASPVSGFTDYIPNSVKLHFKL